FTMGSIVKLSSIPTLAEASGVLLGKNANNSINNVWSHLSVWKGDITTVAADAIVNAADEVLSGGGGVDGAIHKAAGPQLMEACRGLGGCKTGQAKITPGFRLPAKYVVHTVGPIGEHPQLLASAYRESLRVATENGVRSIAFPCISTGVFGYPAEAACEVAVQTVVEWMEGHVGAVDRVVFCMFNDKSIACYSKTTEQLMTQHRQK
ncbi:hypothetical protein LPJ72_004369, partial [Coemansia sp. Benny D160-2]